MIFLHDFPGINTVGVHLEHMGVQSIFVRIKLAFLIIPISSVYIHLVISHHFFLSLFSISLAYRRIIFSGTYSNIITLLPALTNPHHSKPPSPYFIIELLTRFKYLRKKNFRSLGDFGSFASHRSYKAKKALFRRKICEKAYFPLACSCTCINFITNFKASLSLLSLKKLSQLQVPIAQDSYLRDIQKYIFHVPRL